MFNGIGWQLIFIRAPLIHECVGNACGMPPATEAAGQSRAVIPCCFYFLQFFCQIMSLRQIVAWKQASHGSFSNAGLACRHKE
jgi:hypothetical protein